MADDDRWVSRDVLIAYANEQGTRISRYQLERWHKDDLLPRPRRVALGRGKGTESQYPLSAVNQAIFLARSVKHYRDLDALAWFAWTHGYPVAGRVRRMLVQNLQRERDWIAAGFEAFENELDNPIDRALRERTPGGVRRIPRYLRSTLVRIMMELRSGQFQAERYGLTELSKIFNLDLTSRERQSDERVEPPPIVFDCLSDAMNAKDMQDVLEKMSDARLERRLADTRRVWQFVERLIAKKLPFDQVTYGAFSMVLLATHGSAYARWARRWISRELRAQGFPSFEEALIAFRQTREETKDPRFTSAREKRRRAE